MDSKKVKKAFSLVKDDIGFLKKKILMIENRLSGISDLQYDDSKIFKLLENLSKEIEKQNTRLDFLFENGIENSNNSFTSEAFDNYQKLEERFNSLEDRISKIQPIKDNASELALQEVTELLSEKIQLEINSLRMEFTNEMAKFYDSCFNEIIQLKHELNNQSNKKTKKKSTEKTSRKIESSSKVNNLPEEKESKIKKFSKWLFVDDEDEETLNSVKKEVKK